MASFQRFRSQVNLDQLPAVNQRQLVEIVNRFVSTHTRHLDQLALAVDVQVAAVQNRLRLAKSNLVLLEKRLESVPIDSNRPEVAQTATLAEVANDQELTRQERETELKQPQKEQEHEVRQQEHVPEESDETLSDDTRQALAKYRRMINVGVPLPAVESKMRLEGFDPQLLH